MFYLEKSELLLVSLYYPLSFLSSLVHDDYHRSYFERRESLYSLPSISLFFFLFSIPRILPLNYLDALFPSLVSHSVPSPYRTLPQQTSI